MQLVARTMQRTLLLLSRAALLAASANTTPGRFLCVQGGVASTHLVCLFSCPAIQAPPPWPLLEARPAVNEEPVVASYSTALPVTMTVATTTTATLTTARASSHETVRPAGKVHFPSFDDWQEKVLAGDGRLPREPNAQRGRKRAGAGDAHSEDEDGYTADDLDYLDADERLERMAAGRRATGMGMGSEQAATTGSRTADRGEGGQRGTAGHAEDAVANAVRDSIQAVETTRIPPAVVRDMRDRFNYASFDCAALVVATNPEAKGSSAILFSSKEQYMLNRCMAEKFVVVELCDDILVDTVMLANHEFFSSMFKDFRISVSDRYVPKEHAFQVKNPLIWARYIRIDFLTHYGDEYYCPVSVLKVYGTTMMEEYRREEQDASDREAAAANLNLDSLDANALSPTLATPAAPGVIPAEPVAADKALAVLDDTDVAVAEQPKTSSQPGTDGIVDEQLLSAGQEEAHHRDTTLKSANTFAEQSDAGESTGPASSAQSDGADMNSTMPSSAPIQQDDGQDARSSTKPGDTVAPAVATSAGAAPASNEPADIPPVKDDTAASGATAAIVPVSAPKEDLPASSDGTTSAPAVRGSGSAAAAATAATGGGGSASLPPLPPPPPIPPPPGKATQESVFRTITKRLAALERNLTLSHRYLEDQSRELNRVFERVEGQFDILKVQVDRVLTTRVTRQQAQMDAMQQELQQLALKVHVLADEIMFEKRLGFVQLLLIFALVVLVGIVYVPVSLWFPSMTAAGVWLPPADAPHSPGSSPNASPRIYPRSAPVSPLVSRRNLAATASSPTFDYSEEEEVARQHHRGRHAMHYAGYRIEEEEEEEEEGMMMQRDHAHAQRRTLDTLPRRAAAGHGHFLTSATTTDDESEGTSQAYLRASHSPMTTRPSDATYGSNRPTTPATASPLNTDAVPECVDQKAYPERTENSDDVAFH
ncbi:UNC-like C-terminal-domain-containing protein [Thamnocephalis sphaerospora]|uniref:UNC-like C-terminal-domain-containing protein n=1 Tax=Thamnocephalis sphaerospora TaxID=78915 RepID=A0A4P9XUQ1_9FUNG|nr:UNC-like C-terminal-domain-containing protein [Thamnocephalis sphaerospora]|eukprot:RKP09946.1 UNC-like C-terminal-domain-containing protein [Thamnocephalis sphaerospora]